VPRSGRQMKVSMAPSLVAMSKVCSSMAWSSRCGSLRDPGWLGHWGCRLQLSGQKLNGALD
jgi:hypothetical protein